MALPEYIPQYILTTENYGPKDIVTAEHWNEIFNLLISQGNANAHTIAALIARLTSQLGAVEIGASIDSVPDKNVQAILTALEAALTTKVDDTEKGAVSGVATLDATGKVPQAQLPIGVGMIPYAEKGVSQGVATLDQNTTVPMVQLPITPITVTLHAAFWINKVQTVGVPGVQTDNIVFVGATPTAQIEYATAGVCCTEQGPAMLTFTCTTVPAVDLTANVVIMGV